MDEKEKYLKLSHKLYLSYKYRELIHKKKIKRIFPKKPINAFQFYLSEKKGIKLPKNTNTILYWKNQFNKLNDKEKEKYEKIFIKKKKKYINKLEELRGKIFDFPEKPKNAFTFFISEKIKEIGRKECNFNIIEIFEKLANSWAYENIDKKRYKIMEKKDIKRFRDEVSQFEKFGYYEKQNVEEDENEELEIEKKIKIKKKTIKESDFIKKKISKDEKRK